MNTLFSLYTQSFPDYPVSETAFDRITDKNAVILTSSDESGNPIGCAVVRGHSISLLCVDEAHRRHGVGSDLLACAEDHIKHSGGEKITLGQGFGYIFQGVPEDHREAVSFFKKHGYTADWSSVNMKIDLRTYDLSKLKIPACPDDVSFRYANDSDREELICAVETVEPNWLKYYSKDDISVLLAVRNGVIAGFEIVSPNKAKFRFDGETSGSIGCVGVVPSQRKNGIGLRMAAEGLRELKKQGCTMSELICVELADWYARLGFEIMHRQWMGTKEI